MTRTCLSVAHRIVPRTTVPIAAQQIILERGCVAGDSDSDQESRPSESEKQQLLLRSALWPRGSLLFWLGARADVPSACRQRQQPPPQSRAEDRRLLKTSQSRKPLLSGLVKYLVRACELHGPGSRPPGAWQMAWPWLHPLRPGRLPEARRLFDLSVQCLHPAAMSCRRVSNEACHMPLPCLSQRPDSRACMGRRHADSAGRAHPRMARKLTSVTMGGTLPLEPCVSVLQRTLHFNRAYRHLGADHIRDLKFYITFRLQMHGHRTGAGVLAFLQNFMGGGRATQDLSIDGLVRSQESELFFVCSMLSNLSSFCISESAGHEHASANFGFLSVPSILSMASHFVEMSEPSASGIVPAT